MRKILFGAMALWAVAVSAVTDTIDVRRFIYSGPYAVCAPYMVDSVDVNSKAFDIKSVLDGPLALDLVDAGTPVEGVQLPGHERGRALHLLSFALQADEYVKIGLTVDKLADYRLFINGQQRSAGEITLEPSTNKVVIKYLSDTARVDSLLLRITCERPGAVSLREDGKRNFSISDVLDGTSIAGVSLSPNGKYMIVSYRTTHKGGETSVVHKVKEVATDRVVATSADYIQWMPKSNCYYYTRRAVEGRELVSIDPATSRETVLASSLPDGYFRVAPTEDFLLYSLSVAGPAERREIYEVIEPDDRQPGWRNRSYIARYNLSGGIMQPLTFGYHNSWAADISADGSYLLFMTSKSRLSERPTTLSSLYLMNLATMQVQPLVEDDGFISGAKFSPDGRQILITGSPEALGGIGNVVPEGKFPNMFDYQMFIMDIASKDVTPVTKEFNPSVQQTVWSNDGNIYFTAENRDCVSLYRLVPADGKIEQLPASEEIVSSISVAASAPLMAYYGQSAMNPQRLYTFNTRKGREQLKEDTALEKLKDVKLGECIDWNFLSSRGDTIYGRYYLPPGFDASRKYPMVVNYYGGCSPTARYFSSRYPHHLYAALGYVVYVVQPSGASGFGQEFGSRHVNTAGEGPADDIIEGTKRFCLEHPFVDAKKIGCIGASYGGFMTQYLQTKTDIFAAAISHAGISDHTSYWGEGYWGYSYSEVSMARSYPWSHKELYVERSPLYNADKIHTPILFLHGNVDKNVPVGESIQMFTALKLLGRETAMVLVDGQDHHILDYGKYIQWQNTIFAWFAKWLKDDASWWNDIYKPKAL